MTLRRFTFGVLLLSAWVFFATSMHRTAQALPSRAPAHFTTPSPTIYYTPTPNAAMTMMYLHATDTIVAIAKTEQASYDQRGTQAAIDFLNAVAATNQAEQIAIASTQNALIVEQQWTAQASQTQGAATVIAAWTQGAAGGATATQAFWENVTATQLAATQKIEHDALNAKRVSIWGGTLMILAACGLGLLYLGVKIWRSYKAGQAQYIQESKVEPDQQGRYPAVSSDALGRGNKLILPNLAHRAVLDPNHDDLTTEQALINKQSNNELEMTRAIANSPALMRQISRRLPTAGTIADLPNGDMAISSPSMPLLANNPILTPSWSMVEDWNGKGGIPYGVSGSGMELLNLQDVPHGGVFGKTGKGKSRFFLRPFIAGAIAAGHRVMILGKQADFWPFADHPNVTMIPIRHITQLDEAERYAGYLMRIVEEMNRRDDYLTKHHVSTWDRAGRENTLVILDELGNALDMMPPAQRHEAYRWVNGLTKEGRKTGFNIWMASQRAVGFKSIVEQLGRAVFHLADAEASRYALGMAGAEELSDGHFFAKFVQLKRCTSFDPTDDELVRFLQSRSVKTHEPITWIEGNVIESKMEPAEADVEQKIRTILEHMKQKGSVSLSQAQREIYGAEDPRGGKHFKLIQEIWIQMQAESATATGNNATIGELPGSATGIATGSA